jgi:GGDEF domain-containing protein
MKTKISATLLYLAPSIESKKNLIAQQWVSESIVGEIFVSFGINAKYFQSHFAIPIIEYFISVIKGEKEAGDCPIMSKFVRFMITKGMSPRDVFLICMNFRKKLVTNIIKIDENNTSIIPLLEEIADIFDANLSGVLEIYDTLHAQQTNESEQINLYQSKITQISTLLDSLSTSIILVENSKVLFANKNFLQMLELQNIKEYYKKYKQSADFVVDYGIENINQLINPQLKIKTVKIYNLHKGILQYFRLHVTPIEQSDPPSHLLEFIYDKDHTPQTKSDTLAILVADPLTGMYKQIHLEDNLHLFIQKAKEQNKMLIYTLIDPQNSKIQSDEYYKEELYTISKIIKNNLGPKDYLFCNDDNSFGVLQFSDDIDKTKQQLLNIKNKIAKITELYMVQSIVQPLESAKRLLLRVSKLIQALKTKKSAHVLFESDLEKIEDETGYATNILLQTQSLQSILYYKQIPIHSDSTISLLPQTQKLTCTLSTKALSIVKVKDFIYFKISKDSIIKAQIVTINEDRSSVVLDGIGFDNAQSSLHNRSSLCVNADFPITIKSQGENIITANATYLCNDTIGFVLEDESALEGIFDVFISFTINDKLLFAQGFLEEKEKDHYIAKLNFNTEHSKIISEYISKMELSILQEIKQKSL